MLFLIVLLWRYFYRSFILLRVRLGLARADELADEIPELNWSDSRTIAELNKYVDPPPSYDEVMAGQGNYPIVPQPEYDNHPTSTFRTTNETSGSSARRTNNEDSSD